VVTSLQVLWPNVTIAPLHATCPTHFILFDLSILILGKEHKLLSSLCVFLQSPTSLSLSNPNIHHSILFSNSSVEGQGSLLLFYTISVEAADGKTNDFELRDRKHCYDWIYFNFLINTVLICCSRILEFCHIFKGRLSSMKTWMSSFDRLLFLFIVFMF